MRPIQRAAPTSSGSLRRDFGPDLACYGTKEVWMPNLDKLAADGVRYARAFTTARVCSPSRLHPLRPQPIRETGAGGWKKRFLMSPPPGPRPGKDIDGT